MNTRINKNIYDIELIRKDNQYYQLYLNRYKSEKPKTKILSNKVVSKSHTISYVLELVVRKWIEQSGQMIEEQIISFHTKNKNGKKRLFKELDYVLKKGEKYIIGELKVSSGSKAKLKASKQLLESQRMLKKRFNNVDTQIIWVDLNYKNCIENLDKFSPSFKNLQFRVEEINSKLFKVLHLSAESIFNWGVENKIIKTPELIRAALIENELIHQRRELKFKIKTEQKKKKDTVSIQEIIEIEKNINQFKMEHSFFNARVELSQKGWTYFDNKSIEFLQLFIDFTKLYFQEENEYQINSDFYNFPPNTKYVSFFNKNKTDEKEIELFLIDAEKVYHLLTNEDVFTLEEIYFSTNTKLQVPLVDNLGLRRFYYPINKQSNMPIDNSVLELFSKIVVESDPVNISLNANSLLLIDNHRILQKINISSFDKLENLDIKLLKIKTAN
ncbi:MAG: hypothetical protein GQ564_21235 [Bacteroidales bacterium]|nr:hypothetical protein [Bacteroidales bacterium]